MRRSLCVSLVCLAVIPASKPGWARRSGPDPSKVSRLTLKESERYQCQPQRGKFRLPGFRLPFHVETRVRSHWWGDVKDRSTITDHGPEALDALNQALQGSAANRAVREGKPVKRYYRAVSPQELDQLLNKGATGSPVALRWRHHEWRRKPVAYVRKNLKEAMEMSMWSLRHNYRKGPRKAELERAQQRALRALPRKIARAKTYQEYVEILAEQARRDPAFSLLLRAEHYFGGTGMFKVFKNFSEHPSQIPPFPTYRYVVEVGDVSNRALTSKIVTMPKGQKNEREVNFFDKLMLDEVISVRRR